MDDAEYYMRRTIEVTAPLYTCNRGPRPSGALVLIPLYKNTSMDVERAGYREIFGTVRPTVDSPTCVDAGCLMEDGHCVRNLHAEVDAIMAVMQQGLNTYIHGTAIYSINKPCFDCTKHIIRAGISTIYYAFVAYDEQRTRDIMEAAGVTGVHVPIEEEYIEKCLKEEE